MSQQRPNGRFTWNASTATDVIQYNIYAKLADTDPPENTVLSQTDLAYSLPAIEGQATYTVDLDSIHGLDGANGAQFVFAAAAEDGAHNISDFSNVQVVAIDNSPPDAPTGFTYAAP